jgi:hypothetical protein
MNRQEIIDAARKEIEADKAAIKGMAPNEKHAFIAALIAVALLVAAGMIIARWVI